MGRRIFPSPQSEPAVEVFREGERECVYLLPESLYNCEEEFGERRRANVFECVRMKNGGLDGGVRERQQKAVGPERGLVSLC